MPVFYSALYITAIGLAVHFFIYLPKSWFPWDRFPYKCLPCEDGGRIYKKLGVQHWKDKVPDMSKICSDMIRKAVPEKPTPESLMLLVTESCIAEFTHWFLCLAALPVVWICPGWGGWAILVVNALGNLVFVVIQRYNRPRLLRAAARMERLAARNADR